MIHEVFGVSSIDSIQSDESQSKCKSIQSSACKLFDKIHETSPQNNGLAICTVGEGLKWEEPKQIDNTYGVW